MIDKTNSVSSKTVKARIKGRTIYNRVVSGARNKTGKAGVKKFLGDYIAVISVSGKTYQIGIYATVEAAHQAYLKTARDLGIKIKQRKD